MSQIIQAADAVVEAAEALGTSEECRPDEVTRLHHAIGRYRFVVEQAVEVEPWPDAKEIARLRSELLTLRARMEAIELLAARVSP